MMLEVFGVRNTSSELLTQLWIFEFLFKKGGVVPFTALAFSRTYYLKGLEMRTAFDLCFLGGKGETLITSWHFKHDLEEWRKCFRCQYHKKSWIFLHILILSTFPLVGLNNLVKSNYQFYNASMNLTSLATSQMAWAVYFNWKKEALKVLSKYKFEG